MRRKREKSSPLLFFGIFLLLGIVCLTAAASGFVYTVQFRNSAVEIPGEIEEIRTSWNSDGESSHQVYVTYSYEGKVYEKVGINTYSSSMYEGKKISLLCDPKNPGRVQLKSLIYLGPAVFLFVGVIFSVVGGVPFIASLKKAGREKKLKRAGLTIYATVEEIVHNKNYSVNGRHPFVIYCSYRDDYKDITYRFKSENIWTDPSPVFPVGSMIPVLVEKDDYSCYYVNTEELQKKIADYT